jgi:hypothetical protein
LKLVLNHALESANAEPNSHAVELAIVEERGLDEGEAFFQLFAHIEEEAGGGFHVGEVKSHGEIDDVLPGAARSQSRGQARERKDVDLVLARLDGPRACDALSDELEEQVSSKLQSAKVVQDLIFYRFFLTLAASPFFLVASAGGAEAASSTGTTGASFIKNIKRKRNASIKPFSLRVQDRARERKMVSRSAGDEP